MSIMEHCLERNALQGGTQLTETSELLGSYTHAVENLAKCGPRSSGVLHHRLEDVIKQASPGICSAMNLDRAYGCGSQDVLVEL